MPCTMWMTRLPRSVLAMNRRLLIASSSNHLFAETGQVRINTLALLVTQQADTDAGVSFVNLTQQLAIFRLFTQGRGIISATTAGNHARIKNTCSDLDMRFCFPALQYHRINRSVTDLAALCQGCLQWQHAGVQVPQLLFKCRVKFRRRPGRQRFFKSNCHIQCFTVFL